MTQLRTLNQGEIIKFSKKEKNIESRARRAARRVGLLAVKSRQRACVPNLDNFGGFMLLDGDHGYVVRGSRFELSAEDVIEFCTA